MIEKGRIYDQEWVSGKGSEAMHPMLIYDFSVV